MPLTETPAVPPFRLMLPAGWEELPADRASIGLLIERSSAVFASQHRPDLDVEFRRMLETAYRKMQQGGCSPSTCRRRCRPSASCRSP
jgi:hypothetical protein